MTLPASPSPDLFPDIPGYLIVEPLYLGSRTAVYRAIQMVQQQSVVIKILQCKYPSFSELVQFRNQYTIAKNLASSGIIQPLGLEPLGHGYLLVMEDWGGVALGKYIQEYRLDLLEILTIALQIADILHDLSQHRVVHKDIKPSNLLIHPESKQVKLIDFSIASLLPRESQEIQSPNLLEGTLAYLAPEQTGRMNRGIDYRTDFYALGVTLYQLLTGTLPFASDDPMELIHCHIAKMPIPVDQINPAVPAMVAAIVTKLMAKNAEDRYQSTTGLKHDLQQCLTQWKATGKVLEFELGQRDLSDRFLIPEKLYGREAAVQSLLDAFDRVATGTSELMLVVGFSGIGKTAVVNEVHKPIVRQRGYFIKGKYDQFNRNIPLLAFVQALQDLIGQLLCESDEQLTQWQHQILEAVGENGQVLIEVIPELEQIIGKQPIAPELSGSAAQNRFNLLFQRFIAVFATTEHPLVMFLDDLQWADSASLQLIHLLLTTETGALLIIGAYRDNEVSATHPLLVTLEAIAKAEATVNQITLQPLSQASLNQLITDTLNCEATLAAPLSTLIAQKTQGNPFFATQLLKVLHRSGLITFDAQAGHWQCDIVGVRAATLTDDVVEFMALQLQKLPATTQHILKLAACIGSQFDLDTLAIVAEQPKTEIATALWKALQEGLILPQSQVYKFYIDRATQDTVHAAQIATYRFLHDRVQQAAYSLIPDDHKQATHLAIGQLLLENTPPEQLSSNLFEIVNHLNLGYTVESQQSDRNQLIHLNVMAGDKARAAIAYEHALTYFNQGINLLHDQFHNHLWQVSYELALMLHIKAMQVSYFISDFSQAETLMAKIIANAQQLIDCVDVYEIKILILVAKQQPLEALETGLQSLRLLCNDIPDQLSSDSANTIIQYINDYVANRDIADLCNLPEMTNPEALASLRLLDPLFTATYVATPQFIPFIAALGVKLSIMHGNSPLSILMYTTYGASLCSSLAGIESGYQFGELALTLLSRINNKEFTAKILCMVGAFISPWKLHLKESLPLLAMGYQSGLESGTLNYTAFNSYHECRFSFFLGQNLLELEQKFLIRSQEIRQMKQALPLNYSEMIRQIILNLISATTTPWLLQGEAYDEHISLQQYHQSNNREALHYLHLYKLMTCYLFENYCEGLTHADQVEADLDSVPGQLTIPLFHFYAALVRLGYCSQNDFPDERKRLSAIASAKPHGDRLRAYAQHSPLNFQHKYDLVEAEINRVQGNRAAAAEYYDRAIAGAKANGYLQEEALAHELAAKFYLDWGKEKVAAGYMQEAYYDYARWGAKAKTNDLEIRYAKLLTPILQHQQMALSATDTFVAPQVLPSCPIPGTQRSSSDSHLSATLDLATVLKASQALSREIQFDQLLATLLHTVLENAGADKGALLMLRERQGKQQWCVEAIATLDQSVQMPSIPLENSSEMPHTLINMVKRNLQPTVITDATEHPILAKDAYTVQYQPKSMLCTPILQQGKLIAILYLENQITVGAFTRDRVELLNVLCAQAAISLENARLYQQAQTYAQQLEQSQLQIVQSEKMASLGNLVAGVAHEINNPIGFLTGSLDNAKEYVHDLLDHLTLYQQHSQPVPPVQDHAEDIDLEFLTEDLPKLLNAMREAIDRIKSISTSLRTFSRADAEHKVSANVHEGIESTLLILKYRLKASADRPAIEVIQDYADLPEIECFPSQLNQVFMNILANAIDVFDEMAQHASFDYLEANPQTITIQTRLIEPNTVEIRIRDNGKGIADDVKAKIFDYLFTTKEVGRGTGLGLAIARQIVVEKHDGSLEVQSQIGQGTEFLIRLPIDHE
jgi:predicted ATPase/signal transduction histidine kinase